MKLLVNRGVVTSFHEIDRMKRAFLRGVSFALSNNLMIRRLQMPVPLVISAGLPNLEIHTVFSSL